MRRLKQYEHRRFQTVGGPRLMGYVRGHLLVPGPEEYVRQDVLRTLVEEYGYPRAALLAEEPVARGTANRCRADVLVRLPRRDVRVVVTDPSVTEPRFESYSELTGRIHALSLPVEVLAAPDTIEIQVDGERVGCAVRGFFQEHNAISLYLEVDDDVPHAPRPLPPAIAVRVLGYGMTKEEELIAGALGLPSIAPKDRANESFAFDVDTTLARLQPKAWVEGGLSEDSEKGWVVIGHTDNALGVLTYIDIRGEDWWDRAGRAAENAPFIHLGDGRVGYRERLDNLAPGDRVFVERGEGPVVEGAVVDQVGRAVRVRCANDVLTAHVELDVGENWLVGRVDSFDESQSAAGGATAPFSANATFLVVECKAPHIALTEEVLRQGLAYATDLGATFLTLTNGRVTRTFHLDDRVPREVEDIPDYATAVGGTSYDVARVAALPVIPPLPQDARTRPDIVRFHARYRGIVGDDVEQHQWWSILALDDVLRTAQLALVPYIAHGVTVIEDLGLRFHEPTTPSGGRWAGMYRDFVIRTRQGEERIVGMMIGASAKTVATEGNRSSRGRSLLVGALSRAASYTPNLLLDLGRLLAEDGPYLRIRHDGTMTAGRGSVKRALVLDEVATREPTLVTEGKVDLGCVPSHPPVSWDEMKEFVARTSAYLLIREELKDQVRAARRARRK